MAKIGVTDVFERLYLAKFRERAARFGEFVLYERDRGVRDIGLHLTEKAADGSERVSTTLCWFQLKGIQAITLAKASHEVKVRLDVEHLKFWFKQPAPTYLAVYVESIDEFLVLNIQKYIATRWGSRVFNLTQRSVTIPLPTNSVLDEQAFRLILRDGKIECWTRVLNIDKHDARLCERDLQLIWRLGSARSRNAEVRLEFIDWISKTRSEIYFSECEVGSQVPATRIRGHWQFMLGIEGLEAVYPYLDFEPVNDDEDECGWGDDDDTGYTIELPRSQCNLRGVEAAGELVSYSARVRLNDLGQRLFGIAERLIGAAMTAVDDSGDFIDLAPWHHRGV